MYKTETYLHRQEQTRGYQWAEGRSGGKTESHD